MEKSPRTDATESEFDQLDQADEVDAAPCLLDPFLSCLCPCPGPEHPLPPAYYLGEERHRPPSEQASLTLKGKRQKRKRQRDRRRDQRRKTMADMGEEERSAFVQKEKEEKKKAQAALEEKLKKGKINGLCKVILDCDFEVFMNDKENKSLISQLKFMYSDMKKSLGPAKLTITSYAGRLKELVEYHNIFNWHVNWEEKSLTELIKGGDLNPADLVYLSPDVDSSICQFDSTKTYIIGGLVDGTVKKDATKSKAEMLGIEARKLDLKSFKGNSSFRNCLNVNDVFGIVISSINNKKELNESIGQYVPLRMKKEFKS